MIHWIDIMTNIVARFISTIYFNTTINLGAISVSLFAIVAGAIVVVAVANVVDILINRG